MVRGTTATTLLPGLGSKMKAQESKLAEEELQLPAHAFSMIPHSEFTFAMMAIKSLRRFTMPRQYQWYITIGSTLPSSHAEVGIRHSHEYPYNREMSKQRCAWALANKSVGYTELVARRCTHLGDIS
jgi:hypothetical protein